MSNGWPSLACARFFNCFNLRFSPAEKLSLFTTFDRDSSGTVSYDEFIRGVRGEMNEFRVDWVNKVESGRMTFGDLLGMMV